MHKLDIKTIEMSITLDRLLIELISDQIESEQSIYYELENLQKRIAELEKKVNYGKSK